ncbi:MAG: PEP-CTERM sorting domain-containing protein [Verrucomicrobia bacterium]|nr:PEP-CTERM sorting domain-containing protein [Verrucomicrobiota bacterium]
MTNGFVVPEGTTSVLLMLSAVFCLAFRERMPSPR